ncbi:MAG TPA: hypothetical protein VKC56_05120 [Gallionellaceae bacterium]|nr:hypothetical protein [Gallionellaceae bacterium]
MGGLSAPSLLVDISAHGYGHVSQTAPVVNALARRVPGLRITVRSAAPEAMLRRRIACNFRLVPVALDFGMKMASAVEVEVEKSAQAYLAYHTGWEERVRRAAVEMRELRPDLVLANVPYLSLAAAHAAGVRAVGMCSLNWADIYRHYCAAEPHADDIHGQMLAAYNSAEMFLRVEPAMPMPGVRNARSIGPVAQLGRNRRGELDARLGADEKRVLVAMGGIAYRLPVEGWPRVPGVRWLIPASWNVIREDMTPLETLALPFGDVLASSDAVLTKPGYGTFAEAASGGVPVLYVSRGDWPEEPCLVRWLQSHARCREVSPAQLQAGDLLGVLEVLWAEAPPRLPMADGAEEAAARLATLLAD